ncbi:hypothetical protein GWN26_03860, partial [Candidatus Saccharibacteria bacterium]|nr:hypothetical protein [Candidatus Saccharibacteria bacterium]NIV13671.1 hypothetical protein [Fodinibius sp.]NIV71679.1 hypothetical protein [Calditrichia bacterium]NIV98317.1 hypothetical protein [Candidatus Saccharibacteria bacterium]
FAIAAFGLFETTSLAIARFVDSVNKHIENLTGVKGFAGIKKGVQDIEMWLAQNVPGLELLPREWVKRTQDSVDKYQHETHRIRQYTSEASGLKIDSPRIAEGEYESQV